MRSLLPLLLLTGCFRVVHRPTCEELDRYEVGDDEQTPAGTARELTGLVSLHTDLPASWWDGAEATARVLVQADGPAEWVEQQSTTTKDRSFGFGSYHLMSMAHCPNQLELPIVADVASIDGRLGVAGEGRAAMPDPGEATYGGPGVPYVAVKADYAGSTFPPSDEDPADWDDKYAFVNLNYDELGFIDGVAGWGGSMETEEVSSAMAEYVLSFEAMSNMTLSSTTTP